MVTSPEIRGVGSEEERESIRALLRSEFEVAAGVGDAFVDLYDNLLLQDSSVNAECSRVALHDGRVIGHALLVPREIRICEGDCPAGLVGMVVVHPDYRGSGVGSAVVNDVHRLARDRKLGLLILAGDPGYYRRFGYHHAFSITECRVDVSPGEVDGGRLRPATLSDVPVLLELSRISVPPGAVSPSTDRWEWILKTGHPARLLSSNPAMLGYRAAEDWCLIFGSGEGYVRVAVGDRQATVYEAGVTGDEVAVGMLHSLASACAQKDVANLKLRLPVRNALLKAAGVEARPVIDPEFQFKVIDLDVFLASAEKGLEYRIRRDFPEWMGGFLIRTESGSIHLSRESGEIKFHRTGAGAFEAPDGSISMPEWGIGRLLLGQADILSALKKGTEATDLDRALDALFKSPPPSFLLADAL